MRQATWRTNLTRTLSTRTLLAIIAVGFAVPAFAQGIAPPKPATRQAQTAQPPVAPLAPAPSPPKEWTGEDGASGHPEMKASAIRAAASRFESCLEGLWPLAAKRNVSRASFDKAVKGLTPDLRIMDLMDSQPEFTKAFWDYLDILVNDARVQNGQEMLTRHKAIFDKVEKAIRRRPQHHHRDLGRRIRTTARLAATGR